MMWVKKIINWLVIISLGLLVCFFVMTPAGFDFTSLTLKTLYHIIFGFILYPIHILWTATPDWPNIGLMTVSTLFLVLLGHYFFRWLYRSVNPESAKVSAWKWRWTFSIVALVVIGFGLTMSAGLAIHQVGWLATGDYRFARFEYYESSSQDALEGMPYWGVMHIPPLYDPPTKPDQSRYYLHLEHRVPLYLEWIELGLVDQPPGRTFAMVMVPRDPMDRKKLGIRVMLPDNVEAMPGFQKTPWRNVVGYPDQPTSELTAKLQAYADHASTQPDSTSPASTQPVTTQPASTNPATEPSP